MTFIIFHPLLQNHFALVETCGWVQPPIVMNCFVWNRSTNFLASHCRTGLYEAVQYLSV